MTIDPSTVASSPLRPRQPLVVVRTRKDHDLTDEQFNVLTQHAKERGWRLLDIGLTRTSLAREQVPIGALVTDLPSDPLVARLRDMGCPVVRIGLRDHPDDALAAAVLPDLPEAGRVAVDHFADRGFRNLAVIGHQSMEMMPIVESGFHPQGAKRACRSQRLALTSRDQSVASLQSMEDRVGWRDEQIVHWLEALPKPVGILACSQYYAGVLGLMCERAGLSMPEDVAVLGLGNQPRICEMANVPLSAVDTAPGRMMTTAVELLDEMIAGKPVPTRTYVAPAGVIARRSTDILAVDHPQVARAIRYIWDRLDHELSVDDIAVAMRTPRSTLERLFRKHLRRGIHAELRRARLERFAELLRTTDLPVRELAPRVGFNDPKFLHSAFCKTYGTTTRLYRLANRSSNDTHLVDSNPKRNAGLKKEASRTKR